MASNNKLILSIDQGTSGSKAIIFNQIGEILGRGLIKQESVYPEEGFVEQDPEELYSSVIKATGIALNEIEEKGLSRSEIACCGISNQRETFLLWDEKGKPLHKAIVWQCKRSIEICQRLVADGTEKVIREKTGLLADPYFSGTKAIWLNENIPSVHLAIENGTACFGTVDSWLLYQLTEGKSYKTDFTNASRTMFFNLKSLEWDTELLKCFQLSKLNLPEPLPSDSLFGKSDFSGLFKQPIPITGMVGDSHAAAFGERCFSPGSVKITMGTGSSILMNTGEKLVREDNGMVSTLCWSTRAETAYAQEGIIVSCGATMNWLQNTLNLFTSGKEADKMAESIDSSHGVFLIPAFSGLGAPFWMMKQKAQIVGLTYSSSKEDVVRAGLESVPFQIAAIIEKMTGDSELMLNTIKLDGGLSSSPLVTQFISSLLNIPVERVLMKEASALGAAFLAALGSEIFSSIDEIEKLEYDKATIKYEENESIINNYKKWYSLITVLKNNAG